MYFWGVLGIKHVVLGGSALEPPKSALKFVLIAGSASQNTVLLGGFHSSEVEI
jgi:hypothetical protein